MRAAEIEGVWGPAPGRHRLDDGDLVFSGVDLGNVIVAIQPPRGYGDDPVAVYHSPNLPPAHHYLAFYRWLDEVWGADAIVHLGKHGTLEWLPGKPVALTAGCGPDAALGDVPLFYPFVVNDPGEGTQAKRRAHATVIDHLLPPHDPGRHLRRDGPARTALRRVRPGAVARPVEACRRCATGSGRC